MLTMLVCDGCQASVDMVNCCSQCGEPLCEDCMKNHPCIEAVDDDDFEDDDIDDDEDDDWEDDDDDWDDDWEETE